MEAVGVVIPVLILVAMLVLIRAGLVRAARSLAPDNRQMIETINDLLPQTQCERCGYPGCRPYAEAIARGEADIDQCPPGGDAGVESLARLLGREPKPVNPEFGGAFEDCLAFIDEDRCIGCTLCIQACPVDAIVGARKQMHTVILAECTGCELCIPVCPVDCITLVEPSRPAARPRLEAGIRVSG